MKHLFAALVCFLALPAFAQDNDSEEEKLFCHRSHADVTSQIEGPWWLSQQAGMAIAEDGSVAPGVSVPLPLDPTSPERMEMRLAANGGLIFSTSDFQEDILLDPAFGTFELPEGMDFLDANNEAIDVEARADCLWENMPRYAGTKSYDLGPAGEMEMMMVVHFPNIVVGFGMLRFRGYMRSSESVAARPVMFT